jgi:hypothetical protein
MRRGKPPHCFGFVVRNVDAANSLRENMATDCNRAQRGKLLERKLRHLSLKSLIQKSKS